MKIIQINAWMGNLLHPLLNFIKEQDPDIICAQEVFSSKIKVGFDKEKFQTFELIAELFPYNFFAPTNSFEYVNQKIMHGNAIFSKYQLANQQTVFTNNQYADLNKFNFYEHHNTRNIQSCSVMLGSKNLTIANHHGYHEINSAGSDKSLKCMQVAVDHLKTLKEPIILCGDLNVAPDSRPLKLIEQNFDFNNLVTQSKAKSTLSEVFRIKDLNVVCDYIFTSQAISIDNFEVSGAIVSDHRPLILDFNL